MHERRWVESGGVTWEMLTPVSFSTASGRWVMMSSTSPDSLAAPTSPPPLDTMVTFLASHSGLLISSAIWWKMEHIQHLCFNEEDEWMYGYICNHSRLMF